MGIGAAAALASLSALAVYHRADTRADSAFVLRQAAGPARYSFSEAAVTEGRVRWQLVFATGSVEERRWYESTYNADGSVTFGEHVETVTFDEARLGAMVDSYRQWVERCQERGAKRQLLPVSWQHAIEARLCGFDVGVELEIENLSRTGNIHDVALIARGVDVPGLYTLIEWTPTAWRAISDGTWVDVSPTTGPGYKFNDGTTLSNEFGEVLLAVGLVDEGALHDIGSARDGLPFDAVPADVVTARSKTAKRLFGAADAAMRMRSASMATKMRNDQAPAATAPEAGGDVAPRMSNEEIAAIVAEACKPYGDAIEALKGEIEALKAKMMPTEDDGAVGEDGGDSEMPASGANAAPDASPTAGDAEAVARAVAALNKRIDTATDKAIADGALLPASVPAFRAALRKNDKAAAEALLCDVAALSVRSGVFGTGAAPAGASNVKARTADEIRADVLARHGVAGVLVPGNVAKEIVNEINKARAAGTLAEG